MKIVITGHTTGIGEAIHDYFSKDNETIGVSLANGYDISNADDRKRILELSQDADIFVNNAYNNYDNSQLYMLNDIFNLWKDKKKLIFNMSSRFANNTNAYSVSKKNLDEFCMSRVHLFPKIINLKPGLTNTERVQHMPGDRMEIADIISVIDFIISSQGRFLVQSITFGV